MTPPTRSRIHGCLLGGALGDALGAPVEFLTLTQIRARYGAAGITGFADVGGRRGEITDDTQMTLFTAEGLIRAWVQRDLRGVYNPVGVVHRAYLRWLATQGGDGPGNERRAEEGLLDGWLIGERRLWARRAPGLTCLAALAESKRAGLTACNDSKGCGGVMRVAPVGLADFFTSRRYVFELGCDVAHVTHGHPTGYLAAGAMAVLVWELTQGRTLREGAAAALEELAAHPQHGETTAALVAAVAAADRTLADVGGHPDFDPASLATTVESLGKGWIAEEALAIAVYCALVSPDDVRRALILAANHSGDTDSTAAICGNLLGAYHGAGALPADWVAAVELRDVIERLADDLADIVEGRVKNGGELWERYPEG
jgi:ADP-ribosyl-[dinitrogen reductase] hydrolase